MKNLSKILNNINKDSILCSEDDDKLYQYLDCIEKLNDKFFHINLANSEKRDDNIIFQEFHEDSLVFTLNAIGNGKFNFICICDAIMNDSLPKVVLHLLNLSSISNVEISSMTKKNIEKLTKKEYENINEVIKFLKTKEKKFNFIKFDFKNQLYQPNSAILFYTNLLNSFFIKESKQKMYERCLAFISAKVRMVD